MFVSALVVRRRLGDVQPTAMAGLAEEDATLVFYLPTRKLREFIGDILDVLGDRSLVVARELTKIHEEFIRGEAAGIKASLPSGEPRGEATVLVAGARK
jgi:16S rRNA (cytidine1402-2'-O)-methyltransferase